MHSMSRSMHVVGFRTLKTVLASVLALIVCGRFKAMNPVLVLMGVYCAMDRTITASWRACLNQFFGLLIGSVLGFLLLLAVPQPPLWLIGVCLLPVILICNLLHISYAVFLASVIFLSVCTGDSTIHDILARVRDTSTGLAFGLAVNVLVHPYTNAKSVCALIRELQGKTLDAVCVVIFQGCYPDMAACKALLQALTTEVERTRQQLPLRSRHYRDLLAQEGGCMQLAERMVHEVQALCGMDVFGAPRAETLTRLAELCGEEPEPAQTTETGVQYDAVTDYHLQCYLQAYGFLSELTPREQAPAAEIVAEE